MLVKDAKIDHGRAHPLRLAPLSQRQRGRCRALIPMFCSLFGPAFGWRHRRDRPRLAVRIGRPATLSSNYAVDGICCRGQQYRKTATVGSGRRAAPARQIRTCENRSKSGIIKDNGRVRPGRTTYDIQIQIGFQDGARQPPYLQRRTWRSRHHRRHCAVNIVRAAGAPLKVGVLLPRSGFQAGIGQDCQRGVDLAAPISKTWACLNSRS